MIGAGCREQTLENGCVQRDDRQQMSGIAREGDAIHNGGVPLCCDAEGWACVCSVSCIDRRYCCRCGEAPRAAPGHRPVGVPVQNEQECRVQTKRKEKKTKKPNGYRTYCSHVYAIYIPSLVWPRVGSGDRRVSRDSHRHPMRPDQALLRRRRVESASRLRADRAEVARASSLDHVTGSVHFSSVIG